jgi:hypothetical protein
MNLLSINYMRIAKLDQSAVPETAWTCKTEIASRSRNQILVPETETDQSAVPQTYSSSRFWKTAWKLKTETEWTSKKSRN